ncbi:hypothetical protein MD484_g6955, partial [Candolleomyces efflorescens]
MPGPDESTTTASTVQAGPSRLPELSQLVDVNFSGIDRDFGDTESEEQSTPRIPVSSKLPPPNGETPAARLRALLSLVPNHSTPTAPVPPPDPESSSEHESDFDKGESINANATTSMARESLRDVFSRALRPPGDTPQKQKKRRNSIDLSDVDPSPKVEKERERSRIRAKRKSLSDEEVENSYRQSIPGFHAPLLPVSELPYTLAASTIHAQPSFKSRAQPLTMEVLQQRYMNSKSDMSDLDKGNSSLFHSQSETHLLIDDLSADAAELLRELNSSRTSPPVATSTPQHSLHMSTDSQLRTSLVSPYLMAVTLF